MSGAERVPGGAAGWSAKRLRAEDPALGQCGLGLCPGGGLVPTSLCETVVYRRGDAALIANL